MSDIVREMLVSHDSYETRVAVVEDGELVELYVERAKRSVVGNIYLGKITDVLPGMQAAFVDVGLEKNAFLYVDDIRDHAGSGLGTRSISGLVTVGQKVMVQVVKDPMGTKGARVTMDISIPGRFVVFLPYATHVGVSKKINEERREYLLNIVKPHVPEGMGAIVRTAAEDADEGDLLADLDFLNRVWKRVGRQSTEGVAPETLYTEIDLAMRLVRDVFSEKFTKLTVDDKHMHEKLQSFIKRGSPGLAKRMFLYKDKHQSLFELYDLRSPINDALKRQVELPSGGHIVIDKTEALVAIDVNTGSFVGRRDLEETLLRTNLEAAKEALRQLRLRDLGGIIIIDFIDMELDASKHKLLETITELLERDRTKTKISEVNSLGLVQITRKNVTDGLFSMLTEICPHCEGQGRRLSEQTRRIAVDRSIREMIMSSRGDSFLFAINSDTYEMVTASGVNLCAAIRAETGKEVRLVGEKSLGPTQVEVLIEGGLAPVSQGLFGKRSFIR